MLFVVAFLAGSATILAPCVLPVLPYVFLRVDGRTLSRLVPMLVGLAGTFTCVAYIATIGSEWAVAASEWGRYVGVVILLFAGCALLFPNVFEFVARPVAALGNVILDEGPGFGDSSLTLRQEVVGSLVVGIGIGLVWVPCAGPVLSLIITSAILNGRGMDTVIALLGFSIGVCFSIGVGAYFGRTIVKSLAIHGALLTGARRVVGTVVVGVAIATMLGADWSWVGSGAGALQTEFEESLIQLLPERLGAKGHALQDPARSAQIGHGPAAQGGMLRTADKSEASAATGWPMPEFEGVTTWLNGDPVTTSGLRGKVVVVDFWTFDCINCRHAIPHVNEWAKRYKDQGLVVVGVHSPEFGYERKIENVKSAISKMKLDFRVAVDNDFKVWESYSNRYWPALYIFDKNGLLRFEHFGEGRYDESEKLIRELLQEGKEAPARTGRT